MKIETILKKYGIVTIVQASKETGLLSDTILKKVQKGKVKSLKIGNTWLIFLKDLI